MQANYASGSGSTALVFTYIILAGQTDTNGISIGANALSLNGGSITDAAGNAATLTAAAVTDNASYKVDTTAPTVTVTSSPASVSNGSSSTITFQFSETVTGFDATDTTATRGTLSNFIAVDGDTYTETYTRNSNGSNAHVDVTASSYTDLAGNSGAGGARRICRPECPEAQSIWRCQIRPLTRTMSLR